MLPSDNHIVASLELQDSEDFWARRNLRQHESSECIFERVILRTLGGKGGGPGISCKLLYHLACPGRDVRSFSWLNFVNSLTSVKY
jgi:hypothetical protein